MKTDLHTDLNIRLATMEDALFVAETILNAVGMNDITDTFIAQVAPLCANEGVLYSWRNTYVAEKDCRIVGAMTGYRGDDYLALKAETVRLLEQKDKPYYNPDFVALFKTMEPETNPGEFYIDSLYVVPAERHRGVASALIRKAIALSQGCGVEKVTLAVSPENPEAQHLYETLGFQAEEEVFIFGENYLRMEHV